MSQVLAISSDLLFSHGKWNGLKVEDLDSLYDLLIERSEFKDRDMLETNPSYKQIIAQIILSYDNTYFLHRQLRGEESRLDSLCPLSIGGHIESFDFKGDDKKDLIQTGLERELSEEVTINADIVNKEFLGLMYLEDDNPVNYVHMGIFYRFDLDFNDVEINEEGFEVVGWVDKEYLQKNMKSLTYWSRVLVKSDLL